MRIGNKEIKRRGSLTQKEKECVKTCPLNFDDFDHITWIKGKPYVCTEIPEHMIKILSKRMK